MEGFTQGRQPAIDAARGLAVAIMIYVHLVPTEGHEGHEVAWEALATGVARTLYGKGAALFCVLAGIAWALQAMRAKDPARYRVYLIRRALALGLAGLAFGHTLWSTEILAPMALMMLATVVLVNLGNRALLLVALALVIATPLVNEAMTGYAWSDWMEDGSHLRQTSFGWVTVRYFLLDGNYPLIPWLSFPLAGIAFVRVPWTHRRAGLAFALLLPLAIASELYVNWAAEHAEDLGDLSMHPTSEWTPTSLPFLLVGSTWSFALISGLLWWQLAGEGLPRTLRPLAAFGRASLTHYLLHICLLYTLLRGCYPDEDWSVGVGLAATFAYLALTALPTLWWFRRFPRGPLESLLAIASGRPGRSLPANC